MRVVFMGTPDFAVSALEALSAGGHELLCAVTQPDRPKGRSKKPVESPVKALAERLGIPVLQPVKVREKESVESLEALSPEVIVVAAFGQILPEEILSIPPYGCLNIHASLLPKYRGASPIQAAILNGETQTGITIMRMDKGLDTGDILLQKTVPIDPEETGGSLFEKLAPLGGKAILETLDRLGSITPVPQRDEEASKTTLIRKTDGLIRWGDHALSIERMIRAYDPWPGAFTLCEGRQLTLWKAKAEKTARPGVPGELLESADGALLVRCGEGALRITALQAEGKRRMSAADFLRGQRLKPGLILG